MIDFLEYLPLIFGLFIGLLFGLLAANSRFCLLGAISDILLFKHPFRAMFWSITAASALTGTTLLRYAGILELSETHYLAAPLTPLPAIIGGSLFGIGMVLATGCLVKNLIRIGSGCIKSFVVVVFTALSAHTVFSGSLAPVRSWLYGHLAFSSNTQLLDTPCLAMLAVILLFILLYYAIKKMAMPVSFCLKAVLLGCTIWIAWVITQQENADTLAGFLSDTTLTPNSLTFLQPVVNVLDWVLWAKHIVNMGLGVLIGTILSTTLYYIIKKQFVLSGFHNVSDLTSHLMGALCMGVGAAVAGGCSVGLGLSGFSTGSIHAFISLFFMILSATLFLRYIERKA